MRRAPAFVSADVKKSSLLSFQARCEFPQISGQIFLTVRRIENPATVSLIVRFDMLVAEAAIFAAPEHRKIKNCSWAQHGFQRTW